jgi:large subunit ribosomal protein L1
MGKIGKNYRMASQTVNPLEHLELLAAVTKVKDIAYAKFDETIDIAINLGVNPKYADQMVRGACILPHGTGKDAKVLVFAKGDKVAEAKEAGADYVGLEDYAEKITKDGWLDFDKTIATPDVMGIVGKLGRVLGRRGLMPNPKVGTVTFDIARAVKEAKGGKIEFRVEKNGIVHATVGRKSFDAEKLVDNINALMETLLRMRPASAKGTYVKKLSISSSQGPGVRVDAPALLASLK